MVVVSLFMSEVVFSCSVLFKGSVDFEFIAS